MPTAQGEPLVSAATRVEQVILDIVSFTRWPRRATLLRLCVVGSSVYADDFVEPAARLGSAPVTIEKTDLDDGQIGSRCDIVYEGMLLRQERERLLRGIAGHPVLTVGESTPDCSLTTMFCLELDGLSTASTVPADQPIAFSSNLDAIARSGLRLNPRVLLLGRRAHTPP